MNQLIIIDPATIRQVDGLYCLNDLHHMAGAKKKDTPSRFLVLHKTQKLINALEHPKDQTTAQDPKKGFGKVLTVIHGGSMQGVYGSRELVYAYAMWIDPYFYALVLQVFDRATGGFESLTEEVHHAVRELNLAEQCTSIAGRVLCVVGKHKKPLMQKHVNNLLEKQQPQLPLDGGNHEA